MRWDRRIPEPRPHPRPHRVRRRGYRVRGPFVLGYFALAFIMPKEPPLTPEERLSIIRDEADES
jgi:hypothetical protein